MSDFSLKYAISVLVLALPLQSQAVTYDVPSTQPLDLTAIETTRTNNRSDILSVPNTALLDKANEFKGVFEPVNSGGKQAVALGLSPEWAQSYTREDRSRMGIHDITVYERNKKSIYDKDLEALGKKSYHKP